MTDSVLVFHTELTNTLNTLEEKGLLDENAVYLNDPEKVQDYLTTTKVDEYFFNAFTTPKGNMDYVNINKLESEYGITMYAGEKDSFGWLSAVVVTPKGKLVIA